MSHSLNTTNLPHILLVGCGKMGSALLAGWLENRAVARVTVIDPAPRSNPDERVAWLPDAANLEPGWVPDAAILAVKPQIMSSAAGAYAALAQRGTLMLSIAAGRTIAGFESLFGPGAAIVRAMPNTPAAIGRGITVCVANAGVDAQGRALATSLLSAVGGVEWLADEALLDAVTAVSGSGPAYLFLFIEYLTEAGIAAGLPADLALKLARETVAGSGELARRGPEPVEQLRRNVTSPNGTTQAALEVLMAADGLRPLLDRAVAAAVQRSRELAG